MVTGNKIVFIAVVIISNIVQAISGFAGTMLAMPAAIILIGIEDAKVILNAAAIAVSVGVVIKERHCVNFHIFKKIMVGI